VTDTSLVETAFELWGSNPLGRKPCRNRMFPDH